VENAVKKLVELEDLSEEEMNKLLESAIERVTSNRDDSLSWYLIGMINDLQVRRGLQE